MILATLELTEIILAILELIAIIILIYFNILKLQYIASYL